MKRATMIIAATAIMSASAAAGPLTPRNMNDDEWRFSVSPYAFVKQFLDLPKRQGQADIHHHGKAVNLG